MKIQNNAGFNLRSWSSNSENVLSELGIETNGSPKNLSIGVLDDCSKVLGMWWRMAEDDFHFVINLSRLDENILNGKRKPTKREVLKTLMLMFDPLGLMSWFLVNLKILLQENQNFKPDG